MKNNDINNITLPVFKKLEKFAKETNEKLDNVDTSPVYVVGDFNSLTPKKLENAVGITSSMSTRYLKIKETSGSDVFNVYYYHIGGTYYMVGYSVSQAIYFNHPYGGATEPFIVRYIDFEDLTTLGIVYKSIIDITSLTPGYITTSLHMSGYGLSTGSSVEFILTDNTHRLYCQLFKDSSTIHRLLVFKYNYRSSELFKVEEYASTDGAAFVLNKTLYAPDISSSSSSKDDTNTLALKSDILTEYRKNKLGEETYTQITTLQGLVDVCDGLYLDEGLLYIRVNQGKHLILNINEPFNNLTITYDSVTYTYGNEFTDARVVFEGIEMKFSVQESSSLIDLTSYVGNITDSYLNVIDSSIFIETYHLQCDITIFSGTDVVLNLVLNDTYLGVAQI